MDDCYMPKTEIENTFNFLYGDEKITYQRLASIKNMSKVTIKVMPNCSVTAQADTSISDDAVLQALKKRARWIHKKLEGFRLQHDQLKSKQYISGESHFYLGRRYMLKVLADENVKPIIKLSHGKLEVQVKTNNADLVKQLLKDWYKKRAKLIFNDRLIIALSQTNWVSQKPPVSIREMTTQWGSCSPSGRLTLNPNLVKASKEAIDYVILHELCHLVEHNHSEKFYRLLNQHLPNWQVIKNELDNQALKYL